MKIFIKRVVSKLTLLMGTHNTRQAQRKWTDIALAKMATGSAFSWGGDIDTETRLGNYSKLLNEIVLPAAAGRDCLEIGCLDGKWSRHIVPASRHTTLVDLDARILPLLTAAIGDNSKFDFYETSGNELDGVDSETIDFIFSIDTLVRVDRASIKRYVMHSARVLRPGGLLVLHLPSTASKMSRDRGFTRLSPKQIEDMLCPYPFVSVSLDHDIINHGVILTACKGKL